ncbi:MAG: glycosyltransferase family 39 protein [Bdellovibrionaceae bacterium]|nr:glycosyltransferase family 39 protein [Pseudobdellovibrionaceae bacterium]
MFNLLFWILMLSRFWNLGLKPVHHDEAINGWFVAQTWAQGAFTYDPSNYHGPLLFYLFQLGELLGGWGVETFRFVTTLFSVFTMLWLWHWSRRRFQLAGWWALALALSPGFLFFSRSAIHESAFVFFTLMAATAWIDFWCLRRPGALRVFLYGLLGALLLKETFALALAAGVLVSLPLFLRRERWEALRAERRSLLIHVGICVVIWALFYSGFGRNPGGLRDFFVAFLPWMKTGTAGNGHQKEFSYFLKLMWDFEPATVFALALTVWGLFKSGWQRGVCAWALLIVVIYGLIPYKTPWCLISMQLPIWLAAIVVLSRQNFMLRSGSQLLLLALGVMSASHYVALNFEKYTSPHPYIYVQGDYEAKYFVESLQRQAEQRPEIRLAKVQWGTNEPWPFPYWLQMFTNQASLVASTTVFPNQDLYIVETTDEAKTEGVLQGGYWKVRFLVRDARAVSVAYLRKSVFECPMPTCQEVGP